VSDFLKYHFLSLAGGAELESRSTGSTALGIKASQLKSTRLAVPPVSEQLAIVDFLDREVVKIHALIAKVREAVERLQEYRTALISAAVTGKIDVREEGANPENRTLDVPFSGSCHGSKID
jgi:type I restriction enzyme S subunit